MGYTTMRDIHLRIRRETVTGLLSKLIDDPADENPRLMSSSLSLTCCVVRWKLGNDAGQESY